MAYTTPPDFTPFDVLTAAQMDILGNNDVFFYTYTGTGTNAIQQVQMTNYSSASTGTTVIPADDTIPQNTEGDQYMTQAITPLSATNLLIIEASAFATLNAGTNLAIALFQDSTANALAGRFTFQPASGYSQQVSLSHKMTAGTTSSTTFKIRMGPTGAATLTFNGVGGSSYFSTVTKSWIKVTEYKV